jgi:hypothetical protein
LFTWKPSKQSDYFNHGQGMSGITRYDDDEPRMPRSPAHGGGATVTEWIYDSDLNKMVPKVTSLREFNRHIQPFGD